MMDPGLVADTVSALLDELRLLSDRPWLLALALALATYGSEDLACIAGGLIAASGELSFAAVSAACAVGIWTGDVALYCLGMLFTKGALQWKWLTKKMRPDRIQRGARFFDKYGARWIFVSRFIPGSRVVSYLAAGATGWSLKKFCLVLALASMVWTPVLCGIAMLTGKAVIGWLKLYEQSVGWILLAAGLFIWALLKLVLPMFNWRGRRMLYGRWLRLSRWEFWPSSVVYLPVGLYALWLSLKHRSPTLFTVANPAMAHSGFAMDSKGDTLALFKNSPMLPAYTRLPCGQSRMQELTRFMEESSLDWPIVLKPDIGERGQGVAVIKTEEQARNYLANCHEEVIAQEYVGGLEFGVHYVRMPDEMTGRLYSVAGKHPQKLIGDGRKNIEHLVLEDPRAVAMAGYYLRKFADRLDETPAKGEAVILAEIGTHARGAVFTDDRKEITPQLTEAIDRLTRSADGIHCGRYDLRVPSVEDLRAGKNIKILEFNGVTGEPAHIYQPGYPVWRGITDLCRAWRFAYEAGAQNRARGHQPARLAELFTVIREHRGKNWFEVDDL
ncbi:MAG: VTT domain-containing protein [Akkermansiaceae bacterium]|nr:VTT domain-containing protein [Akkermansiaceae bacterium]